MDDALKNDDVERVCKLMHSVSHLEQDKDKGKGDGWTSLHIASLYGNSRLVRELLNAGAVIDAINDDGETALHISCVYGYTRVIRELIKHGANFRIKDNFGQVPFDLISEKKIKN